MQSNSLWKVATKFQVETNFSNVQEIDTDGLLAVTGSCSVDDCIPVCQPSWLLVALLCVSKNDTHVAHYNFDEDQPFLIIYWQRCC